MFSTFICRTTTSTCLSRGVGIRAMSTSTETAARCILVTGAASGLGEAVARRLVTSGRRVIICDLDADKADSVVADLGADKAAFAKCNVSSESDNAIKLAQDRFGGIHGAVNCAGRAIAKKVLGRPGDDGVLPVHALDEFQTIIDTNLVGTFNVTRLVAQAMAKQNAYSEDGERGVIVNTASVAAIDGQIGQAAYASSKGGVVALTLPLARELAAHGIRVCTIAPGIFMTPMMAGLPEKAQKQLSALVPFPKRLGHPSEFARMVEHIIENPMLNGEVIRLDGAIRMP